MLGPEIIPVFRVRIGFPRRVHRLGVSLEEWSNIYGSTSKSVPTYESFLGHVKTRFLGGSPTKRVQKKVPPSWGDHDNAFFARQRGVPKDGY